MNVLTSPKVLTIIFVTICVLLKGIIGKDGIFYLEPNIEKKGLLFTYGENADGELELTLENKGGYKDWKKFSIVHICEGQQYTVVGEIGKGESKCIGRHPGKKVDEIAVCPIT
ncbi:uncharacterized protein MELLADRAFT_108393 [Melampsora larici-populina 98AG31]|uniref:Uncharacterized protein n=1 Tax=Melampsora larici-populina (strain 98AG31 / pathotype 3-4-7) TaxID=747676 RepID=F4RSY8_MELLP|nr:uncharacterized protein MELLADRAFT_108393 [Melampsora larici-populina 98AG31]EGG04522.1 hypothetical protein MELLADRAFT_108393 [Melampsora larici-populina 98AG31]